MNLIINLISFYDSQKISILSAQKQINNKQYLFRQGLLKKINLVYLKIFSFHYFQKVLNYLV